MPVQGLAGRAVPDTSTVPSKSPTSIVVAPEPVEVSRAVSKIPLRSSAMDPTPKVLSWIKSRQIAWAKSKQHHVEQPTA